MVLLCFVSLPTEKFDQDRLNKSFYQIFGKERRKQEGEVIKEGGGGGGKKNTQSGNGTIHLAAWESCDLTI